MREKKEEKVDVSAGSRITMSGLEFFSKFNLGDVVIFRPGQKKEEGAFIAMILGCTFKGPKVSYHMILESGAEVKTYGNRVFGFPEDQDLSKETYDFFKKVLATDSPSL